MTRLAVSKVNRNPSQAHQQQTKTQRQNHLQTLNDGWSREIIATAYFRIQPHVKSANNIVPLFEIGKNTQPHGP